MKVALKVEVQPTPKQEQALRQHAGVGRWTYNWGIGKYKAAYNTWVELDRPKAWKGWQTPISLHRELNVLKRVAPQDGGVPWMYESSKCAPQEALRDLGCAIKNFRAGRAKFPRFKRRARGLGGFRLMEGGATSGASCAGRASGARTAGARRSCVIGSIAVELKVIRVPRVGRLRIKPGDHGYLPVGRHGQVSVTEEAGRWFVSLLGSEVEEAEPNGKPAVGLDLGVSRLATLSDGTVLENPRALASSQRKLKRLSKALNRKQRGSMNRGKARAKLAAVHARVSNVRRDALHKATTTLAKNHGKIVIEDLKVRNMTRAASGRGRKAKAGLNRVVLDAGFGAFRSMLEYKGKRYGCEVVAVPPHHTSQRCSTCGHVAAGNRTSQAGFRCLSCGFEINADLNAAINILEAGSCPDSRNACGAGVRRGDPRVTSQPAVKQESAVAG